MVAASKCSWRNAPKKRARLPPWQLSCGKITIYNNRCTRFFRDIWTISSNRLKPVFPYRNCHKLQHPSMFGLSNQCCLFRLTMFFLEIMWIPATIAGKSKILFIIQNTYSNLQLGRRKLHYPPYFVIWLCLKMGYAGMPRKCHFRAEKNLSHEFSSTLEGFTLNVQVPKTYFSGVPTSRINSSTPTM